MAYELHIERNNPIELAEWISAVLSLGELRLDEREATSVNPSTGEQIAVANQAGTAAVEVEGQWINVFRWQRGKAHFKAPSSTVASDPVMHAALRLAAKLTGLIRGDEGEVYDGSN